MYLRCSALSSQFSVRLQNARTEHPLDYLQHMQDRINQQTYQE